MTAVLIFTVYFRTASSKVFYRFRRAVVVQERLKQRLWQKQLEVEGLINPGAISEHLKEDESE